MKSIWAKGLLEEKNVMLAFRCRLTPGERCELKLAASNLYRLSVNGEMIGYGPARAAHGYSRLDSYSLEKWQGQEIDATVEVYSANTNTFYTVDEHPFFACEITEGDRIIADAGDFECFRMTGRVQRVRRFSFQRSYTEIYHLNADPMAFDPADYAPAETEEVPMNALLERYVEYPRLDTEYAEKIGSGSVDTDESRSPWRDRAYYGIDPVKFKGYAPDELEEDSGEEAGKFVFRADDGVGYALYDFGRTLTGFFRMNVKAESDCAVYILFDEVLTNGYPNPFRNDCCNVVKYSLKAGEYRLISFEANTARYALCCITGGKAEIADFGMVKYENPDAASYEYDTGDEELNSIIKAAVNTFAQNAVDVLTDCPSRERAGWLCDSYFTSRSERLFTGKNLVEKSFLENYAMCPQSPFLPEGMIPMCYPADHNDGVYIPNWSMWYILELEGYLERTGDRELIDRSRDKVYGLVKFFSRFYNEFGLLENLENWVFIEWSRCNDGDFICGVNYPSNMLWSAALEAAGRLYGDSALIEQGAAIRETVGKMAFNGEYFEDNAIRDQDGRLVRTGHTSETCQYYAFYFGAATRESHPELFEKLLKEFGPHRDPAISHPDVPQSNAFIGNYLRLELMLRAGCCDQVLADCRGSFSGMASLTGTLWEHARVTCSLNHGFASLAAYYIDIALKNGGKG